MGKLEKAGIICVGCLIAVIVTVGILNRGKGPESPDPKGKGRDVSREGDELKRNLNRGNKPAKENPRESGTVKNEKPVNPDAPKRLDLDANKPAVANGPAGADPKPVVSGEKPKLPASEWPKQHEIKSGDNPESLAKLYYNNIALTRLIVDANPGMDPKRLKLGTMLAIPEPPAPKAPALAADGTPATPKDAVAADGAATQPEAGSKPATAPAKGTDTAARRSPRRPSFISPAYLRRNSGGRSSGEVPVSAPGKAPKTGVTTPKSHKVASGETLGTIAAKYYGSSDARYRSAIQTANASLIKDPNKLIAGWSLAIPAVN